MEGKKLWKKEFDDMVYKKLREMGHPYTRVDVYWFTRAYSECIVDLIENGDTMTVMGKYTIKPKLVKSHRTGNFGKEPMIIPEHYVGFMEPGTEMIEACEKLMQNRLEAEECD